MPDKINAEEVLELLAKIRKAIPYELRPRPRPSGERATGDRSIEDFEMSAVQEALEQLTEELGDALDRANETLLAHALNIYYAAEELARDPANAHLIPHVEEMRRAYESSYGTPIPPKKS